MGNNLILIVFLLSKAYGIDPAVSYSIISIESSFNKSAIGPQGEVGYMQLNPKFFNVKKSQDIIYNLKKGIAHLKFTKDNCKIKDQHRWVICYNTGISGALRLKDPNNFIYYKKFIKEYRKYSKMFKNKFKEGDKVIIKNLYQTADGTGVILEWSRNRENPNKWLVKVDHNLNIFIEPERLVKDED